MSGSMGSSSGSSNSSNSAAFGSGTTTSNSNSNSTGFGSSSPGISSSNSTNTNRKMDGSDSSEWSLDTITKAVTTDLVANVTDFSSTIATKSAELSTLKPLILTKI
jgi:hypothetical protein